MTLPSEALLDAWPPPSPENPLRVLVSGCLAGRPCGVDGTSYGPHDIAEAILALPSVRAVSFCPEDAAFGTPRSTPNIYGGDGFDVLDGGARVKTDEGDDWTDGLVAAAHQMLTLARRERVQLALLMDISAACGSQVIYDGPRHLEVYRAGPGVAAALLMRNGIPVVSQRDFRTLGRVLQRLGRPDLAPAGASDHHETAWYRAYFGLRPIP